MKISVKPPLFLIAVFAFSLVITGCSGSDGDGGDDEQPTTGISGSWQGETERGFKFSMILQQDGTTVTGTYKDDVFEAPLENGEINENVFTAVMVEPTTNDILDISCNVDGENMNGTVTHRESGATTDIAATRS